MMPSHCSMLASLALGRTERSKGAITVGPVTTDIAPNSKEISQDICKIQCADKVPIIPVTIAPTGIRLRTILLWPRISENRRVRLPSNKMMATARETMGNSKSPNTSPGFK